MRPLLKLRLPVAALLYAVVDAACVGAGMGVPVFCIFLGLLVGWYSARREIARARNFGQVLSGTLRQAAIAAGITLLMMAVIWGRCTVMLFDPNADLANFGIPQILYHARASFIGWLVLMIVISPVLQFLVAIFASHLTLLRRISIYETGARRVM